MKHFNYDFSSTESDISDGEERNGCESSVEDTNDEQDKNTMVKHNYLIDEKFSEIEPIIFKVIL